jgi:TonB family protein
MRVPIWRLAAASFVAVLTAFPTFPADTIPAPKMPDCRGNNHEDYYPPPLIRTSTQGEVLVDFRIDQHGSPRDIRVLASSPNRGQALATASLRLLKDMNCPVPKDWAKTGGSEHQFRVWIFWSLTAGAETSPAPTAAELGVDGVIQVTATFFPSSSRKLR